MAERVESVASGEPVRVEPGSDVASEPAIGSQVPRRARRGSAIARILGTGLGLFGAYLVLDGIFFSDPFIARHFPASFLFSLAPVFGLYLGWPAIFGCGAAEAVVCLSTQVTVHDPVLWLAGVAVYVAAPYVLWYAFFSRSPDPYPRLDGSRQLACALVLFFLTALAFALLVAGAASVPDAEEGYAWGVLCVLMPMSSLTTTVGIVVLVAFAGSPVVPRAPRWIRAAYVRCPMLSLTQRLVLIFSVISMVTIFGLLFGFIVFISEPDGGFENLLAIVLGSLLIGDVMALVLWCFVIYVIWYLQTRFSEPIERLSIATRAFPSEMEAYQDAVESGAAPDEVAGLKARAADPVDMAGLRPAGEAAYLAEDTDAMRASLVRYLDEVRAVTAEQERVRAELDIASRIQQGAVPHDFEELDEALSVQVAASMTPARDVGGDFYDAFRIDATHLGVIMADVSGKGMPAALFMMRALAELKEQMFAHADDMGTAISRANRALCEHNEATLFVTGIIGALDVETGVFSFANGGHNPPWVLGPDGTWLKARKGLVLGVIDMARYRTEELRLAPGGGLFLYTDGVTEAMDADERQYGDPRLDAILRETEDAHGGGATAQELIDAVLADVERFVNGAEQSDDLTALAFRWLPRAGTDDADGEPSAH